MTTNDISVNQFVVGLLIIVALLIAPFFVSAQVYPYDAITETKNLDGQGGNDTFEPANIQNYQWTILGVSVHANNDVEMICPSAVNNTSEYVVGAYAGGDVDSLMQFVVNAGLGSCQLWNFSDFPAAFVITYVPYNLHLSASSTVPIIQNTGLSIVFGLAVLVFLITLFVAGWLYNNLLKPIYDRG